MIDKSKFFCSIEWNPCFLVYEVFLGHRDNSHEYSIAEPTTLTFKSHRRGGEGVRFEPTFQLREPEAEELLVAIVRGIFEKFPEMREEFIKQPDEGGKIEAQKAHIANLNEIINKTLDKI